MKLTLSENQSRSATIATETFEGKTSKRISISSDLPIMRRDRNGVKYYEVLSHAADGINDERIRNGLPIYYDHNEDQFLGRAPKWSNSGRGLEAGTLDDVIWSASELAQEKRKDVESGALVATSVGYSVRGAKLKEIGIKDGVPIVQVSGWIPKEFSFLPMEADVTCGVGRVRGEVEPEKIIEIAIDNPTEPVISSPMSEPIAPIVTPETPASPVAPQVIAPEIEAARAEGRKKHAEGCGKIDAFTEQTRKHPDWFAKVEQIAAKHRALDADYDSFRTEALDAFPLPKSVVAEGGNADAMTRDEFNKRSPHDQAAYLKRGGKLID